MLIPSRNTTITRPRRRRTTQRWALGVAMVVRSRLWRRRYPNAPEICGGHRLGNQVQKKSTDRTMSASNQPKVRVKVVAMTLQNTVDRLFKHATDRHEQIRTNPVTGGRWVNGVDPIKPQKEAAYLAFMAREWFAENGPADAPPLPLSYAERVSVKGRGLPHVVMCFAYSLKNLNYDFNKHPSFDAYARGVLASPYAPDFITSDQVLVHRYPPETLYGLGRGLCWQSSWPPAAIRRASRAQQQQFLLGSPPVYIKQAIPRAAAKVPDTYAPWAQKFLQLTDEFIAHVTQCAPYKRLPRSWCVDKPDETYYRIRGSYMYWVIDSDNGWLIERDHQLNGREEILSNFLLNMPVLCPTYAIAARLAEACLHDPAPVYYLQWEDRA
jgi:hypothetical protein